MDEPSWQIVAACVAGAAHARAETACQDAQIWRPLPGGLLLAAVADGAGSALHPDVGAQTAVANAVEHVVQHADRLLGDDDAKLAVLREAFAAARDAIEREADARDVLPRELATTLILAVAARDWVATGQIGDGAAIVRDKMGAFAALTQPQCGEHVNETVFVVSPDMIARAQWKVWHGRAGYLALFSDGLQRLALRADGAPHAPFFAPLFRCLREAASDSEAEAELTEFVTSAPVAEKTEDDITLVLARYIGSD